MGEVSGFFGFGKDEEKSRQINRVNIPDYLRPFIEQSTNTAGSALGNVEQLAGRSPDEMVAGFDPLQNQAQQLAIQRMMGEGGFLPQAQQTFMQAAQGTPLSQILGPEAYGALTNAAGGGTSALPDNIRAALSGTAQGQGQGVGGEALAAHARGDYLYGGEGFDAAMEAAMNRIQPQVQSRFGLAGPGAATGGLAQAAFNQGTSDAFAGLYNQNLNRQLGAANTLTGQALDASGMLGSFNTSDLGRQMSAAAQLGNFGQAERGNQLNAAAALPNLSLFESNVLGDIGAQRQGLEQQRMDAPFLAQLQLLQSAMGGLPIPALLGSESTADREGKQFMTGAEGSYGFGFPGG